jgi:hypothetical protein
MRKLGLAAVFIVLCTGFAVASLPQRAHGVPQPLRPPNGTYVYSLSDAGSVEFKSTLVIKGSGSTFDVSEATKLPNGPVATTRSTWSSTTLLPLTFEVHQDKIRLRAQITPTAVKFIGIAMSFPRIQGTSYMLPSVGLITHLLMLPYVVSAHPGESLTLAEIQNNQTVLIRPWASQPTKGHGGDMTIAVAKDNIHGKSAGREQVFTWVNRKTGIMDGGRATPGDARITLLSFTPGGR